MAEKIVDHLQTGRALKIYSRAVYSSNHRYHEKKFVESIFGLSVEPPLTDILCSGHLIIQEKSVAVRIEFYNLDTYLIQYKRGLIRIKIYSVYKFLITGMHRCPRSPYL